MRARRILAAKMRKSAQRIRNTSSGQATGFSFTIARNSPHSEAEHVALHRKSKRPGSESRRNASNVHHKPEARGRARTPGRKQIWVLPGDQAPAPISVWAENP